MKILQFGEGNFLRAFADYYFNIAVQNGADLSVNICQPRVNTTVINALKEQACAYNVLLKGALNNEVIDKAVEINCVKNAIDFVGENDKIRELMLDDDLSVILSNTTEAGICFNENDRMDDIFNASFPAKLTILLYDRFNAQLGDIVFLPVELIDHNGDNLKKCILDYISLWKLGAAFEQYINENCHFCNTLVDRIVTGKIEYKDDSCAVSCEPYGLWLIHGDEYAKGVLSFLDDIDDISFVDDLTVYKTRKVRILNGAHTMSVLGAYHYGFDIVRDMINDEVYGSFVRNGIFNEVIPTIDLPEEELREYAESVFERFANPYIDHKLLDISLNSVSKFKARCLPSLVDYCNITSKAPRALCFGFASLIYFYRNNTRNGDAYTVNDDADNIDFIRNNSISDILSNSSIWGVDINTLDGVSACVEEYYDLICRDGVKEAIKRVN